jgi:hypothetical protein
MKNVKAWRSEEPRSGRLESSLVAGLRRPPAAKAAARPDRPSFLMSLMLFMGFMSKAFDLSNALRRQQPFAPHEIQQPDQNHERNA